MTLEQQACDWIRAQVGIEFCARPDETLARRVSLGWASLQPLYWTGTQREDQMSRVFTVENARGDAAYTAAAQRQNISLALTEELSNGALKKLRLAAFTVLCKSVFCYQSGPEPSERTARTRAATAANCGVAAPFVVAGLDQTRPVGDYTPSELNAALDTLAASHGELPSTSAMLTYAEALLMRIATELSVRPESFVVRSAMAAPENVELTEHDVDLDKAEGVVAALADACSAWQDLGFGHFASDAQLRQIWQRERQVGDHTGRSRVQQLGAAALAAADQAREDGMQGLGLYTRESRANDELWHRRADAIRKDCEQASLQTKAQRPIITRRLQILVLYKMHAGFRGSATRALTALERSGRSTTVVDFQTLTYRQLTRLWESERAVEQALALTSAWGALVFQYGDPMEAWLEHNVHWRGCTNESVLGRFGASMTASALVFLVDAVQAYMDAKRRGERNGPPLPREFEEMLVSV